jgi:hypothetical protein
MLLPIAHVHAAVREAFDQVPLIVFFLSKGKTVKAERERERERERVSGIETAAS